MKLRWLVLALAAGLTSAAVPPASSVTLEGEAIPLSEALDSVGRQLNRRINIGWPANPQLAKTYAFHLRNANQLEALTALQEACGLMIVRAGQAGYNLTAQVYQRPRTCLGKPLPAGWMVWFDELRAQTVNQVRNAGDGPPAGWNLLTTRLSVQATCDVEAARLLSATALTAVSERGQELAPENRQSQPYYYGGGDPLVWELLRNVAAPGREDKSLARVGFELVLAKLKPVEFVFDATHDGPQTQTDGDVDATLELRRGALKATLTLTGAALAVPEYPPGWLIERGLRRKRGQDRPLPAPNEQALLEQQYQLLRRDLLLQAQLFTAAGKPLYTQASGTAARAKRGWAGTWTLRCLEDSRPAVVPQRLVVRFWVPQTRREVVPVEFANIALPPLD